MMQGLPACILNDTRVDLHHGCHRVMLALHELLGQSGFSVAASSPAHTDWTSTPSFLKALEACRLIVVNGEGTIHHDRPAGRKLLEVAAWARARQIPAVLLNAGWESNSAALASMAKDFALVSVRDSASAQALRAQGVSCRVVPDLSLYAGPWSSDSPRGDAILFSDSVEPSKALGLEKARQACSGEPLSIIHSNPGLAGYLSFIRGPIAKADLAHPMRALKLARMRHRLHRVSSPDTSHFLQRLATGALLVSGRFHACTLALCTGTPFISVPSNTGKITALIQDAGLDPRREQTPLDCASLRKAQASGWSTGEAHALTSYVASAKTAADALFADIRCLV